eukprot:1159878-Pelagomonas_calceolata.AAC.2
MSSISVFVEIQRGPQGAKQMCASQSASQCAAERNRAASCGALLKHQLQQFSNSKITYFRSTSISLELHAAALTRVPLHARSVPVLGKCSWPLVYPQSFALPATAVLWQANACCFFLGCNVAGQPPWNGLAWTRHMDESDEWAKDMKLACCAPKNELPPRKMLTGSF